MRTISRRDALGVLGLGIGTTASSLWLRPLRAAQQAASRPLTFPPGAIIRTIQGDLAPSRLNGAIFTHEHLSGTTKFSEDIDLMVGEAAAAKREGVACIVDAGHQDMGRNLASLRRIANESGLPIVASGGYYTQRSYPPEIAAKTAEQIADDLVHEATAERYGAFGEIGQIGGVMTPDEQKVFRAVGMAQARTGLPIITHNAYTGKRVTDPPVPRDSALRQLDMLEAGGATAARVALGHICCLDDPKAEIAIQIAKRGAFVAIDRVTLETVMMPDAHRVIMILAIVEAGYADHIVLSSEFYAESSLRRNGGGGLAQTKTVFGPKLLAAGLPEATLNQLLNDNPRRLLAFVPRAPSLA